jgi:hypothetical protein
MPMPFYRKSARQNRIIGCALILIGALGLIACEKLQSLHRLDANALPDFVFGSMIGIGIGFLAFSYSRELNPANGATEQKHDPDQVQ